MKKYYRRLKTPAGVLPWVYPRLWRDSRYQHHKRAFWHQINNIPWTWSVLFYMAQQFCWYSYFGWKHYIKGIRLLSKKKSKGVFLAESGWWLTLWELIFIYTIPIREIISNHLLEIPKREWLDRIYVHEVPKWQYSIAGKMDENHMRILNDKYLFGEECRKWGIPSVSANGYFEKGHQIKENDIFLRKSLFVKPNQANQSRDCYSLIYKNGKYTLNGLNTGNLALDEERILKFFNELVQKEKLLAQELLFNHPSLAPLTGNGQLITYRIISQYWQGKTDLIAGVIEIPKAVNNPFYYLVPIDVQKGTYEGKIGVQEEQIDEKYQLILDQLGDQQVEGWEEIKRVIVDAHSICRSVRTIGWDVAYTESGPVLIEGNIGWNPKIFKLYAPYLKVLDKVALN